MGGGMESRQKLQIEGILVIDRVTGGDDKQIFSLRKTESKNLCARPISKNPKE